MEEITICIPTWKSEAFIQQTLQDAQAQDYPALKILVSVDKCDDRTAELCCRQADMDDRIRVFEQPCQLGWTRNSNFLLDQVTSDFYAIYFHDDRVERTWISTLCKALQERPEAMSAYCCVRQNEAHDVGEEHAGDVFERLMRRAVGTKKGSPLRALTRRSERAPRFPEVSRYGYHAQQAYLVELLAMGPLIYVSDTLYRRWNDRGGGVTDSWKTLAPALISLDIRRVAMAIEATVDQCLSDLGKRDIAAYALRLLLCQQVLTDEKRGGYDLDLDKTGLLEGSLSQEARARIKIEMPQFTHGLTALEERVERLVSERRG